MQIKEVAKIWKTGLNSKDFFDDLKLEAIKTWMSDDVKDIMIYTYNRYSDSISI